MLDRVIDRGQNRGRRQDGPKRLTGLDEVGSLARIAHVAPMRALGQFMV
jgi:hypothetical protein